MLQLLWPIKRSGQCYIILQRLATLWEQVIHVAIATFALRKKVNMCDVWHLGNGRSLLDTEGLTRTARQVMKWWMNVDDRNMDQVTGVLEKYIIHVQHVDQFRKCSAWETESYRWRSARFCPQWTSCIKVKSRGEQVEGLEFAVDLMQFPSRLVILRILMTFWVS